MTKKEKLIYGMGLNEGKASAYRIVRHHDVDLDTKIEQHEEAAEICSKRLKDIKK
jgi:hypothetical protein